MASYDPCLILCVSTQGVRLVWQAVLCTCFWSKNWQILREIVCYILHLSALLPIFHLFRITKHYESRRRHRQYCPLSGSASWFTCSQYAGCWLLISVLTSAVLLIRSVAVVKFVLFIVVLINILLITFTRCSFESHSQPSRSCGMFSLTFKFVLMTYTLTNTDWVGVVTLL